MHSISATEFGIKVCVSPDGEEQTIIAFNSLQSLLSIDTRQSGPADSPKDIEAAPFSLDKDERLRLRIFVDKSVVEVFANDRQALARRIYPERTDSLGVRLFANGGSARVHVLQSWHMSPSNPY
jgi:beta-fructofuranosidase